MGCGAKAEWYPAAVPTWSIRHPGGVKPIFTSGDKSEIAHWRVNRCVTLTITHDIPRWLWCVGSIRYNSDPDDLGKCSYHFELYLLKFLEMSLATLDLEGL